MVSRKRVPPSRPLLDCFALKLRREVVDVPAVVLLGALLVTCVVDVWSVILSFLFEPSPFSIAAAGRREAYVVSPG